MIHRYRNWVESRRRGKSRWSRGTLVLLSIAFALTLMIAHDLIADEVPQRNLRIGFVGQGSATAYDGYLSAFREQLKRLGYVEGRNLAIEIRWADGHADRLSALVTEVLQHPVDVIVTGGTLGAMAAKKATNTVPIIVVGMGDPVRSGLAATLARPGGNLTGFSMGYSEGIAGKWLELLQETMPRLSTIGVITHPDNPWERDVVKYLETFAPKRRMKVEAIEVWEAAALDNAFEQARRQTQAVVVFSNAITLAHRSQITKLATTNRIPAMYTVRTFVDEGGLMAYAPDLNAQYKRAADYADKIFKGARPTDLPIEQPTQYVLVINVNAAKAIGLTIPQSILLRADEIIK